MRLLSRYISTSLLLLSLTSWAHEAPLRIGIVQEFSALNPITMNLASTEALIHFVVREVTVRNEKGQVIPDLAVTIPSLQNKQAQYVTEGGTKKIKATWTLQPKAKWSDGKPVTCQDWWLGWQAGLSPNTTTVEKNMFSKIEKIEWKTEKPHVCSVTYSSASWTFDRDLPHPIPYHLENSVFEKWKNQKEAYDQNTLFVTAPTTAGLYNGPYQVQEFKLGSHITFVRNPHFYGEQPKIPSILVKHIGDASTLQAHLKTKSINMVSAVGFPPDLALTYAANEHLEPHRVFFQNSPVFQGLFINHEDRFLSDPKVRQALALSINKKRITEAFFNSKLQSAETFLPPYSDEFEEKAAIHNIEKANKLLDEAGWQTFKTRAGRVKNGESLTIEFKTSAGIKILETIQVYICSEFAKIQVSCRIKNEPPRILLGDTINKGNFALALFGNSILPDTSLTSLFSSKEIPTKENSWAGGNNLRWKSKKMDQLLARFDAEADAKKRSKILKEMETEILSQTAFIPLYHRKEATVIPDQLSGLTYLNEGTGYIFPERWALK